MKFCKNLQRVVDISDPEWAPYWTNYKMLKKLIKELPSLVPSEECAGHVTVSTAARIARADSDESSDLLQQHGDQTTERPARTDENESSVTRLERNPGEKAFFKLLHAELKKAVHFFEKAQQEFMIREERVREGMEIMKQPNAIMVGEKWSLLAKSIYRLYKDLLLLETFAIMTYCSFSKILKKHDKVTGHQTRAAFMQNVVNKANFTNYPLVLQMINRCEKLFQEVSERLMQEGKDGLYEDERLFINMINRLNQQVLNTADGEGAAPPERKESQRGAERVDFSAASQNETSEMKTLRSLVEEHDARASAAQVSELEGMDERKRPADGPLGRDAKQRKL